MTKFKIIPNIKVNYTFFDLFCASFVSRGIKERIRIVEKYLGDFLNVDGVLLTSSGRSALYHLLSYLPQHRVIVPAYTCDVVIESIVLAGKNIVFAHIDKNTLNISEIPDLDSDCIFIATHQYGFPCDIKKICSTCKQKGAVVIEDCAGALGIQIDGQMAGTFGDFAIFSFNASKLINSPSTGGFLIAKRNCDIDALKKSIKFKPCTFKYKVKNLMKSVAFCIDKIAFFHFLLSKVVKRNSSIVHLPADTYHPNPNVLNDYLYGFYEWQAYVVLKQLRKITQLQEKRGELMDVYREQLCAFYNTDSFNRQNSCIRYPVIIKERERIRRRIRECGI